MSLRSFSAYTREVDDIDAAVSELLEQLDLGGRNKLLRHSVGIVSCYSEYAHSGIGEALCEKLPFEIIGATTIMNATAGELGETMLCMLVMTSDELSFATGLSAPIASEDGAPLAAMYEEALVKLPGGKPSLMLSFAPLLQNFSSDFYIERMSEISGNVPNFGALAVDHNADYCDSRTMLNGRSYRDRFAVLLVHGPAEPAFFVGNVSGERVFADRGVVTDSEGNHLKTVDGIPVIEYLESLGLTKNADGTMPGVNAFPVIVDYNDGSAPVARAMFALTPEGYAVCGGSIPVGANIAVGSFDEREIIGTSCRTLAEALASGRYGTLLVYSCVGRFFAQGYNPAGEFSAIQGALDSGNERADEAGSGGVQGTASVPSAGGVLGGDRVAGVASVPGAAGVQGTASVPSASDVPGQGFCAGVADVRPSFAYMAAYSGGELCPVRGKDGSWVNRNHNNSIVVCGIE